MAAFSFGVFHNHNLFFGYSHRIIRGVLTGDRSDKHRHKTESNVKTKEVTDMKDNMKELNEANMEAVSGGTGPLGTGPLKTGPLETGPLGTGPLKTGPLGAVRLKC